MDLIPHAPWWGEVIIVGTVILWVLSLGVRQRDRLDADRTQRSLRAMADPARKDIRRVGGVFTGLLFIFWALVQELAGVGNDLFGLAGSILTSYPDFGGFSAAVLLGWSGLSGHISLSGEQYIGLALVIGSLVLMVKN